MKSGAKRRVALMRKLRAIFVLLHVLAVVALSLPAGHKLADRRRWKNQRTQREFKLWAKRLQGWGVDTDPKRLDSSLWSAAQRYLVAQQAVIEPFRRYDMLGGMSQGWGMFRSPQRKPAVLLIEVQVQHKWRTVYRSRSDEHTYLREQLDHNRIRKLVGRAVRDRAIFEYLSQWIVSHLVDDYPKARRARVSLMRFDSLPPEQRKMGKHPKMNIQFRRNLNLQRLRQ